MMFKYLFCLVLLVLVSNCSYADDELRIFSIPSVAFNSDKFFLNFG